MGLIFRCMGSLIVGVVTLASAGARAEGYYEKTHLRTVHNQGNIQTVLDNVGVFGSNTYPSQYWPDPLTGTLVHGTVYPRNSANIWSLPVVPMVGGAIDRDTFVSYAEFLPDQPPDNVFQYQSLNLESPIYSVEAHSEFDIICSYNDSISDPTEVGSGHHPLNIRVRQRSMAWSASNLDDFILVDLEVMNIGTKRIDDGYVGLRGLLWARHASQNPMGHTPDVLIGSIDSDPKVATCDISDSQSVYYGMCFDGNPADQQWDEESLLGALGITILHMPGPSPSPSFNWNAGVLFPAWQPIQTKDLAKWRQLTGDKTWYFLMSNGYRDYDQMTTALDHTDQGWLAPPSNAPSIADGHKPDYVLGVGPFDLGPGQSAHLTYAIVGGEDVHVNPTDFETYWDPYNPGAYYSTLDFTDLMTNARWAKWVYDNPGIDTDGDGYFGKFRECDGDTVWYEGDGVPDFRADIPPPSPKLKVIPSQDKLVIRWNGYYSENAIDPFTKIKDFEGYRVYMGLDDRESSMSTLITWDYQDYNRWYLKEKPNHTFDWVTGDLPLTIDSLRLLYGDSFYPLVYTRDNPMHLNDSLWSFTKVDYNLSSLNLSGIHKVYPDARWVGTDTTTWTADDLTEEHGTKLPKYYEYEYTVENVLSTIANYVSVTAFDFGLAKANMPAQESSKRENMTIAYAQTSADSAVANNLNVYVYPNPYLYNVDYAGQGYENHDNSEIPARSHRVNFGNLPPKCRISIYSLDGDLIRSWEHEYAPSDPQAMHDAWDLITRNTMLAVAGLYYWVVEAPGRTQIGKLVLIM
jgi:hypothetical protein